VWSSKVVWKKMVMAFYGTIFMPKKTATSAQKPQVQLPKDALNRVDLGDAFAEYDKLLLRQPGVFVKTPALQAASSATNTKCFFIGRRGTGKTAITYYLTTNHPKTAIQLHPLAFVPTNLEYDLTKLRDTHQKYFKSLVHCFKRAFQLEVLRLWNDQHLTTFDRLPSALTKERNHVEEEDFDTRLLTFIDEVFSTLEKSSDKNWVKQINRSKEIGKQMDALVEDGTAHRITLLIDRVDEAWDGTDKAVVCLMAMMHACVELNASSKSLRPFLFLRENIFERVRQIDNEFSRLETSVVSLDWTRELLLEVIERRLNAPFTTKLPLRGPTWDYFFENLNSDSSRDFVFTYCQERPRDVLMFCSMGLQAARSHTRTKVAIEDIQETRRKFSESRLKDLGDEYAENYPQVQLVLSRFYGLGQFWLPSGIDAFVRKLLVDDEVKNLCKTWIFNYTAPDSFIHLLYAIGFVGVGDKDSPQYRSLGAGTGSLPAMTHGSYIVIHPSYTDALNLHNVIISTLADDVVLTKEGILVDLPDGINLNTYTSSLTTLEQELKTLPKGKPDASRFEEIIGEVIKLCFFRSLTNVQPRVREVSGCCIRDWIAANHATHGFWEVVRLRYHATQIVWECKNYDDLSADDFHQASYYMSQSIGYFVVVVFRGEVSKHNYDHIKRIATERNGLVLLLTEKDVLVFIRQARNGNVRESHIQELFDRTVREIS
jgi:hypothetical protein